MLLGMSPFFVFLCHVHRPVVSYRMNRVRIVIIGAN